MKKQSLNNTNSLKQDVKILKQDVKSLKQGVLLINGDVKNLTRSVNFLTLRLDILQKEFTKFQVQFDVFKDKMITNMDWLIGAFKKFDEEHTILTGKYSDVGDKLDNHETRIKILEAK